MTPAANHTPAGGMVSDFLAYTRTVAMTSAVRRAKARERRAKIVISAPIHFLPVIITMRHAVNIWTGAEMNPFVTGAEFVLARVSISSRGGLGWVGLGIITYSQ